MSALTLVELRRTLGGNTVLEGLSLALQPGELFALLGPSGSGKTTLLRLIAGLDQPDAGLVCIDGENATPLPPERRGVAVVFQQPLLFPHLTVAANVGFGLRMRGVPANEARQRVDRALAQVHMGSLGARYPAELSGGQQQRVALARALVVQPKLLLLDEPFSHLDPGLRLEMRSLLRELQAGSGVTTLLVTHDHDEALQLADRLGVLLDGRVAQAGPPAEVLARPASRAVAAFMQAGTLVPGHASDGSFTCALGTGSMPNRAKPWPDGPAWVVIPPSALQVTAPGQGTPAEVASIRLTRRGPELEVRAGGHLLTVWSAAALAPGQAIGLAWDPQSSWFVYD